MYQLFIKNILDILFGTVLFILTFPVFFIISVLLFFINKGQIFFRQIRVGKKEKLFRVLKFKTMIDTEDGNGSRLSENERITSIGKFLRKTHLDEIPQFINVLKGEMSLIGPRPLLPEYLPLYDKLQRQRHFVKPGITGWAQVQSNEIKSWGDIFVYDNWYVEHISLLTDIKIFFFTLRKIAVGVFASVEQKPKERFTGKN